MGSKKISMEHGATLPMHACLTVNMTIKSVKRSRDLLGLCPHERAAPCIYLDKFTEEHVLAA